ncbi:peroxisome membrane protein [Phakopsora pachyrhizi]|nr:peroxisome membrane protein [Phakopsora pachyrhizi]KAI8456649.1 peroxisome membrane protein [Phakopsora pachyrhizi]
MTSYQEFLLSNATRIASIESTLRSLTWFLPGRFKDAELASEALYASLNLLSVYHDRIITKATSRLPASVKPPLTSHGRYTTAWSSVSTKYNVLSHALVVISHTELLIEMCARRKLGSRKRWRVVIFLECVKAILRLQLVNLTGRMLVNPPLPHRAIDPSTLENTIETTGHDTPESSLKSPSSASNLTWTGKRTGISHPSIASRSGESAKSLVNQYLARKALTVEEVLKPLELVRKLQNNRDKLAELIWILRPVIYVIAISRCGRSNFLSFFCSLSIEYLSFSLRQSSLEEPRKIFKSPRRATFQNFVSELERNESNQRRKAFWTYLLKGPLWIMFTRPKLLKVSKSLSGKPLLNLLSMIIQDYTPLIDEYYYYTA